MDNNSNRNDLAGRVAPGLTLTKQEWAHIIGVIHLDTLTGNKQSITLFEKLTKK